MTDYKEKYVDHKYRKVFVTAHMVLRTAGMFLARCPWRITDESPYAILTEHFSFFSLYSSMKVHFTLYACCTLGGFSDNKGSFLATTS